MDDAADHPQPAQPGQPPQPGQPAQPGQPGQPPRQPPRLPPADDLRALLGFYDEELPEAYVDCEGPLESGLRQFGWSGYPPDRARAELAGLLAEDLNELGLQTRLWGGLWDPPAGGSTHEFARYLLTRIDAWVARPPGVGQDLGRLPADRFRGLAFRSGFPDPETANQATAEVLQANQTRLRSWSADQVGEARLWLSADLGRSVGEVNPAGPDRSDPDGRLLPAPGPLPAGTCVTLLRIDPRTASPAVLASYPTFPMDPGAARRWPELTLLFGGYFGQGARAIDGGFWEAERAFHEQSSAVVVDLVATALGALLAAGLDHQALKRTLHDLGCCLDPVDPTRWATGLHRRMIELDWFAAKRPGPAPPPPEGASIVYRGDAE